MHVSPSFTVARRGSRGVCQLEVALPSPPVTTGFQARRRLMKPVIIGMDPHKRSATIEIIDDRERVLRQFRAADWRPLPVRVRQRLGSDPGG
jgi:hypothetical protein